jgi:hypothetical protein
MPRAQSLDDGEGRTFPSKWHLERRTDGPRGAPSKSTKETIMEKVISTNAEVTNDFLGRITNTEVEGRLTIFTIELDRTVPQSLSFACATGSQPIIIDYDENVLVSVSVSGATVVLVEDTEAVITKGNGLPITGIGDTCLAEQLAQDGIE